MTKAMPTRRLFDQVQITFTSTGDEIIAYTHDNPQEQFSH